MTLEHFMVSGQEVLKNYGVYENDTGTNLKELLILRFMAFRGRIQTTHGNQAGESGEQLVQSYSPSAFQAHGRASHWLHPTRS